MAQTNVNMRIPILQSFLTALRLGSWLKVSDLSALSRFFRDKNVKDLGYDHGHLGLSCLRPSTGTERDAMQ